MINVHLNPSSGIARGKLHRRGDENRDLIDVSAMRFLLPHQISKFFHRRADPEASFISVFNRLGVAWDGYTFVCIYIYYTYIKVDKRGRGELQILFVVTGWSEWRNETAVFSSLYAKWRKTFYVCRFKIAVQIILEISENQLKVRRTWLRYFVCISTPYFYSEEFKFLICRPTGYDLWSIVVSFEIFGVKETHHNIDHKISKLKKKPT